MKDQFPVFEKENLVELNEETLMQTESGGTSITLTPFSTPACILVGAAVIGTVVVAYTTSG